jgi:hypothetical protein
MNTGVLKYGDRAAREVSERFAGTFATRAALTALSADFRADGALALVSSDNSLWVFDADLTTASTGDPNGALLLTPDAGDGRWVRADKCFFAKLALTFETADATALLTFPEGFAGRLVSFPYWEVTTGFTGGTSSTIGISTNLTGYDTKGDLLGGASGDAAATLVAGITKGTAGGELNDLTGFFDLFFEEGSAIRFDTITSAFEAGAGYVHVPLLITQAPATP